MRVGICVDVFPRPTKTFIADLVTGLLDRDVDLRVYALAYSPFWRYYPELADRAEIHERMRVLRVPAGTLPQLRAVARGLARVAVRTPELLPQSLRPSLWARPDDHLDRLATVIRRLRMLGEHEDLLHFPLEGALLEMSHLRAVVPAPIVVSVRSTLQACPPYVEAWTRDHLFRVSSGYQFVSEYVQANTLALGLSPDTPHWLIHETIVEDRFSPPIPAATELEGDRALRVLSVGRLSARKGLEHGVRAVGALLRRGVDLEYTVVGAGEQEQALRSLAAGAGGGQAARIRFTGLLNRDAVRTQYRWADVLLHPALDDPYPNVILEAQAMGIPAVASAVGGIPEMVRDGTTGLLVAPGDSDGLAAALARLEDDRPLCRKLGAAARADFVARNRFDDMIDAVIGMYESVIAGAARRVPVSR